jgi:hypothetical protein
MMMMGYSIFVSWNLAFLLHGTTEAFSVLPKTTTIIVTPSSCTRLFREPSKWDLIEDNADNVDNDDDDDDEDQFLQLNVRTDMKYQPHNVVRQNEHFVAIREVAGSQMTNDVYVREPGQEVCWYTGKVARVSDVSLEQTISRQWNLIETHAVNLRPIELSPSRGRNEILTAPGDSEIEVAYNRPTLLFQKRERQVEGAEKVKSSSIGFQGEIYDKDEQGFRTWRTQDGRPNRPEINAEGETQAAARPPPTTQDDLDFETFQKETQGKDIKEVYEEQKRRKAEYEEQERRNNAKGMNNAGGETSTSTRAPTQEEMERFQKEMQGRDINEVFEEQERKRDEGTL